MATYTQNLNLMKPDLTDSANIGDINNNMDILDGAMTEYIVEQGEGYRLWNSGKAEAWGSWNGTASATSVWNTPIYYNDYTTWSNLFNSVKNGIFIETPIVNVTSTSNLWWIALNGVTKNGIASLRILTVSSKSNSPLAFDWYATGKWK